MTIKVLVVDDHPVFREGFAALLGSIDEIDVIGTASNGVEAVEKVLRQHPDVVVMDVSMPEMDGIEATRRVLAERPRTGVVVLTMSEEDGTIFDALRAGARGYLLKGAEPDEVVRRWSLQDFDPLQHERIDLRPSNSRLPYGNCTPSR